MVRQTGDRHSSGKRDRGRGDCQRDSLCRRPKTQQKTERAAGHGYRYRDVQTPRHQDTKTPGYSGKMEVISLLQGRREKLWERREELTRGIARAEEGLKNEEELDMEAGSPGGMVGGRDVGEMARWNRRRLREKIRRIDEQVGRVEEVIEMGLGEMEVGREEEEEEEKGEGEEGSRVSTRGETGRTIELARKRIQKERRMLEVLCAEVRMRRI